MGQKSHCPYLSDKSLGSSWAHKQHGPTQCIPVAMQFFHSHCSEQTCDHHVDIRFHLLKGYVHSLMRSLVQEILNATDICGQSDSRHYEHGSRKKKNLIAHYKEVRQGDTVDIHFFIRNSAYSKYTHCKILLRHNQHHFKNNRKESSMFTEEAKVTVNCHNFIWGNTYSSTSGTNK